MLGILVVGDNHFIVRGPKPDSVTALELARLWSVIQIGAQAPAHLEAWRISTREFREDLQWAAIVEDPAPHSPAVVQLLDELRARGVIIERY